MSQQEVLCHKIYNLSQQFLWIFDIKVSDADSHQADVCQSAFLSCLNKAVLL